MKGYFSKDGMEYETKCKKCCIFIGAAIHLVFAVIIGAIFVAWLNNAMVIQNDWKDSVDCDKVDCDVNFYD